MRKFILVFLILINGKIYADIDYMWNFGNIGFDYTNTNNEINIGLTILNFYWIETNTGFGLNVSVFDAFKEENDYFISFFPIEIIYTPISYKSFRKTAGGEDVFVNWTVYYRFSWGRFANSPDRNINNIVGIRVSNTTLSLGRSIRKEEKDFTSPDSVFFEYNITDNSFRFGINMDYSHVVGHIMALFIPKKQFRIYLVLQLCFVLDIIGIIYINNRVKKMSNVA